MAHVAAQAPPAPSPAPSTSAKKRQRKKKSAALKAAAVADAGANASIGDEYPAPPVIRIARHKHWRYVSSYHGAWLSLPLELLESLLASATGPMPPQLTPDMATPKSRRARMHAHDLVVSSTSSWKPVPPPIDPGAFRGLCTIKRLVDEASDLTMRASSGISFRHSPFNPGGSPFDQQGGGGGRKLPMSAARAHKLRVLAVQKLAEAYQTDEIASSVIIMQTSGALEDLAEQVLKRDPNDLDALYVHFFHQKVASSARQICETTTEVLDRLIEARPSHLEYWRTRGVVYCLCDDYRAAIADFTHGLTQSRAIRKSKHDFDGKKTSRKAKAIPSPTDLHPSVESSAPDPIELQFLFHRGIAQLAQAVLLIERAILSVEGTQLSSPSFRLSQLPHGKFGGIEPRNPYGPLGPRGGPKLEAYRAKLATAEFRENDIFPLLRKSIRDHERFLAHFDTMLAPEPSQDDGYGGKEKGRRVTESWTNKNPAERVHFAFHLIETLYPSPNSLPASASARHLPEMTDFPMSLTTYHPLLVEAHFSILLCMIMLGEFPALLQAYVHTANIIDGTDGHPIFLPAKSIAQSDFVEVLERLATSWKPGAVPHSYAPAGRAIEAASSSSGASSSSSSSTVVAPPVRSDAWQALDSMRVLLAPIRARQVEKRAAVAAGKSSPLMMPLHGPRVDVVLGWLGAVHLYEMEASED